MKKFIYSSSALLGALPMIAFAQTAPVVQTSFIQSVMGLIAQLIKFAFPVLTAIAVLVFIWSLIMYIKSGVEDKEKNRKGLMYSLLALFIIVSLFGILRLMQNIVGVNGPNVLDNSGVPIVEVNY